MFFLLFSPQLNYENVPVKSIRGDRDWKIITFPFLSAVLPVLNVRGSTLLSSFCRAWWCISRGEIDILKSSARMLAKLFRLLCCHFFFSFYFLNDLQSDNNNNNNNNTVHVLEHKYVLAFLVVILTLLGRLGLKLLSRPQNIFIPAKLKFYNWLAAHNLSLVLDTVMTFFLGINRVREMVNIP